MAGFDAYTLARAHYGAGRWQDALDVLSPVITEDPNDADALVIIAHCRLALEDVDGALVAADAAARVRPDSPYTAIARSAALLAAGRRPDARQAADHAISVAPQLVAAHVQRVRVDAATRVTAQGTASARAALTLSPNDPTVHVAIGSLALRQGKPDAAERSFAEALRLDPDNRAALYSMASMRASRTTSSRGVEMAKGLVRAAPDEAAYEQLLRRSLSTAMVTIVVASVAPGLVATPSGDNPLPPLWIRLAVLLVAVAVQVGAVIWLRRVGGPNVFVFLGGSGRRRALAMISVVAVLGADVCVLVALLVPGAGDLTFLAMFLAFAALFLMLPLVLMRTRPRKRG